MSHKDFEIEGVPYRVTAPDQDGEFLVLEALPGRSAGMKAVGEGWIREEDEWERHGDFDVGIEDVVPGSYRGMEGSPAVGAWTLENHLPMDWLKEKFSKARAQGNRRGRRAATDVLGSLRQKLHPTRFPGMSPMMASIVGMVVGEEYATPALVSIRLTRDGHALARQRGDTGFNVFLGSADDLAANWFNLIEAAELGPDEIQFLTLRMNQTIRGPASKKWMQRLSGP